MASGKEYKLDSIEDIASLIRDIIKKRNDYHDMAVSDRYSEEIKSKISSQATKVPASILTSAIVASLVSGSILRVRKIQSACLQEGVSITDEACIIGATYIIFGEICSLCKQVLMAQLIKSNTWDVDNNSMLEAKLLEPKNNKFRRTDLEKSCEDVICNSVDLKSHLIKQDQEITEINRYIMSLILYQQ